MLLIGLFVIDHHHFIIIIINLWCADYSKVNIKLDK